MLETYVERRLVTGIKELNGRAYKFTSPGNSGVPDRMCVLPKGRIIFVELKRPGGKLSPLQANQQKKLRRMGCDVRTLWTAEDVDSFIAEVGHEV